jgi:hypothetical protein
MITTDIINKTFINKIISRDLGVIQEMQSDVAYNVLQKQTGALQESFSTPRYSVKETRSSFSILQYLRFIDIHYKGSMISGRKNVPFYNKAIWPILYRETLPELRYGLTKDMIRSIRSQLVAATAVQSTIQFPE